MTTHTYIQNETSQFAQLCTRCGEASSHINHGQTSVIDDSGILPRFVNRPATQTETDLIEYARRRTLRACEEEGNCFEPAFVEMAVEDATNQIVSFRASSATVARLRKAVMDSFLRVS
jgi:hypothetical protein